MYKKYLVVAFNDCSSKLFCERENKGVFGKEWPKKHLKVSENRGYEQENVYV